MNSKLNQIKINFFFKPQGLHRTILNFYKALILTIDLFKSIYFSPCSIISLSQLNFLDEVGM